MKLIMIKLFSIFLYLSSMSTSAGVSVIGTRFFFNNETKKINIKIMNDNESDYLIKTDVKGGSNFVVIPPLLLIKKNQSNIVSIVPNNIKFGSDQVFNLVITAIPKSDMNTGNKINLAIRSNFKLIYRHKKISDNIFKYLFLINSDKLSSKIYNLSDSFVSIYISCTSEVSKNSRRVNILPNEKINVGYCSEMWGAILNDDESLGLVNQLKLSK